MKSQNQHRVSLEYVHTHTHTHTHSVSGYLTYKKVINNKKTQVLYILYCYCKRINTNFSKIAVSKIAYSIRVSFYCVCLKAKPELQIQ